MDFKNGLGTFWSLKIAIRGFQDTKNVSNKFFQGPKGRPREPQRDENGTGAPLFGVSGGPPIDLS